MNKTEITQLFYPEDKNLEHFYKVINKLRNERLKKLTTQQTESANKCG